MGTKQIVVEEHPPYMGCALQLSKEGLEQKLKEYEVGDWVAEEKLDGQWCEVRIANGVVQRIISRNGIAKNFVPLLEHKFHKTISGNLVGEMGYGSSNPNLRDKILVVYDFVMLEGRKVYDGTELDNTTRRTILEKIPDWTDKIHLVDRKRIGFYKWYKEILKVGGEGIILKKLTGEETYYKPESRSEYQIKVKKEVDVDMIVMGVGWRDAESMSDLITAGLT
jgi:ATP-dependent DNA ligase